MAFNTTQVNRKDDKQRKLTVGAQFKVKKLLAFFDCIFRFGFMVYQPL